MVRLVTSRVHRCYSSRGAQRSALNEKICNLAHVVACTALILHQKLPFTDKNALPNLSASVRGFGVLLLFCLHVVDIIAVINAHKMFYRQKKPAMKSQTFFTTPSKVDAVISCLYLIGSLSMAVSILLQDSSGYSMLSSAILEFLSSISFSIGAIANLILSLPSLDFNMPADLARSQNFVCGLFLTGSLFLFQANTASVFWGKVKSDQDKTQVMFSFVSYVILWVGAIANFSRISNLIISVRQLEHDNRTRNETEPRRGLLSWFKSSRSVDETADYDSDLIDEEEGDSGEEMYERSYGSPSVGGPRRYRR